MVVVQPHSRAKVLIVPTCNKGALAVMRKKMSVHAGIWISTKTPGIYPTQIAHSFDVGFHLPHVMAHWFGCQQELNLRHIALEVDD